jgi:hypothetical protein
MGLIDHNAVLHHWLATATALYDPSDLGEGVRIYRKGVVAKVIRFPQDTIESGVPEGVTLGVLVPDVGWIEAMPSLGFRAAQVRVD